MTVSFACTVYGNPISVSVILRQYFGTGGSPSAYVDTAIGAVTLAATATLYNFSLTGAVPTIAGKTLGTNGDDYAEVIFLFPSGTTFTLNLWNVQAEDGVYATPFELRPKGIEKMLCQRYFHSTFADGVSPGHNNGSNAGSSTGSLQYVISYPVEMRRVPTVTTYSCGALTTGKWNFGGSGTASYDVSTAPYSGSDARKLHLIGYADSVTPMGLGSGMLVNYAADAEL